MRAVLLDRDGVINKLVKRPDGRETSPWTKEEVVYYDGAKEAVRLLTDLGFLTLVISNQPGIEDGEMERDSLTDIMTGMKTDLGLTDWMCISDKSSPAYKPGRLGIDTLIGYHDVDVTKSFLIGDRWKDIVPGHSAGLTTIFVGTKYTCPEEYGFAQPDYVAGDILEAAQIIERLVNG